MKIKWSLLIIVFNIMMISCQSTNTNFFKDGQTKRNWQPCKQYFPVDSMDVYFNKEKTIVFKGDLSSGLEKIAKIFILN